MSCKQDLYSEVPNKSVTFLIRTYTFIRLCPTLIRNSRVMIFTVFESRLFQNCGTHHRNHHSKTVQDFLVNLLTKSTVSLKNCVDKCSQHSLLFNQRTFGEMDGALHKIACFVGFRPFLQRSLTHLKQKVEGSLDLIPSPSVKIQITGGKVCLRHKGKTLLGFVNKLLKTKSLLTSPSNVLPYTLK